MLDANTWYTITLLPLSDPAWSALATTPRLPPALLDCLRTGVPALVRSDGGDPEALLHVADGPADQREVLLPLSVVDAAVVVPHTDVVTTGGAVASFVKLADDSSAFYLSMLVHRLDAATTAALVSALS